MALLEVRGLTRRFVQGERAVAVFEDLDLVLECGQRLVLTGRSGSGKSTLLNLLAGLDRADAGAVRWTINGERCELGALHERDRTSFRRRHLGFVFQFFNLVPTLSAQENVALMAEMNGLDAPLDRARDGLVALGLGHRLHALPETLSGVNSSALRLRAPWCTRQRSCSRTSRREISIGRPATRSSPP